MAKKILFGDTARAEIKIGVDAVGNTVRPTIGPMGRNVIFDKGYGGPTITNDGGSSSREVVLEDPIQNMGANVIKEIGQKTNDMAGDGRTTSIIIGQAIYNEGLKKIAVGVNAVGIKNGIKKASVIAVEFLKSASQKIVNDEETIKIATISSESEEIGKVISETVSNLGADSVISVEESPMTIGIFSEISQGMEFDKGFVSPYMISDVARGETELRNVAILVTDMKIAIFEDILPILEQLAASGRHELVIIAEDIVGEALHAFILNKMSGGPTVLGIKAPGFGARKKDYLEDIAAITGATFVSSELGINLSTITVEHLGSADKVVAKKDKTTIIGGKGTAEAVADRIATAKKEIEASDSKHDKLKIEERIARLSGGVAVIKVGAATETETKYLKLKIEDAVNSVKAALEEGIVAGGGSMLIRASMVIRGARSVENYTADELIGFDILAKALEAPLENIAINAGYGDGSSVVAKVKEQTTPTGGFDALKGMYVDDMIKAGIVDPVKVERCAIENAASGASMLLTTEVAMAELPKNKSDNI